MTREGLKLVEHDPKLLSEYFQALKDVNEHFRSQLAAQKRDEEGDEGEKSPKAVGMYVSNRNE